MKKFSIVAFIVSLAILAIAARNISQANLHAANARKASSLAAWVGLSQHNNVHAVGKEACADVIKRLEGSVAPHDYLAKSRDLIKKYVDGLKSAQAKGNCSVNLDSDLLTSAAMNASLVSSNELWHTDAKLTAAANCAIAGAMIMLLAAGFLAMKCRTCCQDKAACSCPVEEKAEEGQA